MSIFSKIGIINNTDEAIVLDNLEYSVIDGNMPLKDFNKLKSYKDYNYLFLYDNKNLYLKDFSIDIPSIYVDFTSGSIDYRRRTSGAKQEILRAVGFEKDKN